MMQQKKKEAEPAVDIVIGKKRKKERKKKKKKRKNRNNIRNIQINLIIEY